MALEALQFISTGDALIPKIGKGITGVAKDVALRAGTEGAQGGLESITARSSLSDVLNLTGDNRLDITENLAGAFATELMSGWGSRLPCLLLYLPCRVEVIQSYQL